MRSSRLLSRVARTQQCWCRFYTGKSGSSADWSQSQRWAAGLGAASLVAATTSLGYAGVATVPDVDTLTVTAEKAPSAEAPPASLLALPAHLTQFSETARRIALAAPSLLLASASLQTTAVEAQPTKSFNVIAAPGTEEFALWLVKHFPRHFTYHPSKWDRFPDGTDNIQLGGFTPVNEMMGADVLFLASFHNNGTTLTQYHALVGLCESFIHSLTVLLPYYPTATMERVTNEGTIATANTMAKLFSHLPSTGKPTRLMVYDLHTLQNRFFFDGSTYPQLCTAFPLILDRISQTREGGSREGCAPKAIDCVVFPDDGAEKRFGYHFQRAFGDDVALVTCSKHRDENDPTKRSVVISDGNPKGKHVIIIDDLVQSGGTLYECAKVCKANGALSVSAFVTHAVFPGRAWRRFAKGGDRAGIIDRFYITNSNPTITQEIPTDDVFIVLDIMKQFIEDL
tara:strand:- start:708 stop:2072 length:1365 start_codon:yes stop_codon:yes gene_type:complete